MSWLLEDSRDYITHEVLVRFNVERSSVGGPRTALSFYNQIVQETMPGAQAKRDLTRVVSGLVVVKLPDFTSVQEAIALFNAESQVIYAEPQYRIHALAIPNDPRFPEQWNLNNEGQTGGLEGADINAPEGWDINNNAEEIIVAVLDTGVDYNHPDLYPNMWYAEGYIIPEDVNQDDPNFNPEDPNYYVRDYGPDFVDGPVADDPNDFGTDASAPAPNGDPNDLHWHGTSVAGIIGARGDNDEGISGVAPIVKIMAIRVFDENAQIDEFGDVIDGIGFAVDNGARIINMSWELAGFNASLQAAMEGSPDVLFVCSAGNDGENLDFFVDDPTYTQQGAMYPAAAALYLDNVIAVMATDQFDRPTATTNYGPLTVTIGAPGVDILTCTPQSETGAMGPADANLPTSYGLMSGTSAAAPHISGACALALGMDDSLTPVQLKRRLEMWRSVDQVLPELCVSEGRLVLDKFLHLFEAKIVLNVTRGIEYDSIQEAIDEAGSGDDILAEAGGFYSEALDFLGKSIRVRSGDPDNADDDTTINPIGTVVYDIDELGDGFGVAFQSGETADAILLGFTIDHARDSGLFMGGSSPTIESCYVTNSENSGVYCVAGSPVLRSTVIEQNTTLMDGGGIYAEDGSVMTLQDCAVVGNIAVYSGGGVYCIDSNLVMDGSTILANQTLDGFGGGVYSNNGPVAILNSKFIANQAPAWEGGGLYAFASTVTLDSSTFSSNLGYDGGAVYCIEGTELAVKDCVFQANAATFGGGAIGSAMSSVDVKSGLFVQNTSESWDGGALYFSDTSAALANCTFSGNDSLSVNGRGGVMRLENGTDVQVRDSILSDNFDAATYIHDESSSVNFDHCLFHNNDMADYENASTGMTVKLDDPNNTEEIPGAANISGNPQFVTGHLGNFYLSQYAAGQILDVNGVPVDPDVNPDDATSPAVDAGSGLAVDLGMNMSSTRTDNLRDASGDMDSGIVDIGFHYVDLEPAHYYVMVSRAEPAGWGTVAPLGGMYVQYTQILLTATVDDPNRHMFKAWKNTDDDARKDLNESGLPKAVQTNVVTMTEEKFVVASYETVDIELRVVVDESRGNGQVDPRKVYVPRGETVTITAIPDQDRFRVEWHNTNDDYATGTVNTVTIEPPFKLDRNGREIKEVRVEFYTPAILNVPEQYGHIQQAIDAAKSGDIIVLAAQSTPYRVAHGYSITKAITLQSARPDDPETVAKTIIELELESTRDQAGFASKAFTFTGVEPNAVLNGLTIRGFNLVGINGPGGNGNDGEHHASPGADVTGSAILCEFASPTIKNCAIIDCSTTGGNGGNGANGTDTDPQGGHGGAPGMGLGGAIACLEFSNPIVKDCRFVNCLAIGGNGGDGGDAGAGGAPGWGGGWDPEWAWTAGDLDASYYALYYDKNVKYAGLGGAAFVDTTSAPEFVRCEFTNNSSAAGVTGVSGILDGLPFALESTVRWQIDGYAGAVSIGAATMFGLSAESLTIVRDGKIWYLNRLTGQFQEEEPIYCKPNFVECAFTGNDVNAPATTNVEDYFTGYGGAVVAFADAEPTFEGCVFSDNRAPVGGSYFGENANPLFSDCDFVGNFAFRGGAIDITGGSSVIEKSRFTSNLADELAVYVDDPNLLAIQGPIGQGGAIWHGAGTLTLQDSVIRGNEATLSGGGVYLAGGEETLYRESLLNCLITGNLAGGDGGGLSSNQYAAPLIENCTIANNTVFGVGKGGGLSVSAGSSPKMINSIVWGNTGLNGSQVALTMESPFYTDAAASLNVTYSDIQLDMDSQQIAPSQRQLDLVLCIDTTASMLPYIEMLKNQADSLLSEVSALAGNLRVAIIDYRDINELPYGDPNQDYPSNVILPFESKLDAVASAIESLTLGAQEDKPSSVFSGLMNAVDANNFGTWRVGDQTKRLVVLLGNAPGHDPEPITGYLLSDVAAELQQGLFRRVFTVPLGGDIQTESQFDRIARVLGGAAMSQSLNDIVTPIVEAVKLTFEQGIAFYLDDTTKLNGWDPETQTWDPKTHNISANPQFVVGYYLSQTDAGQQVQSPAVDAGTLDASTTSWGANAHTTRTDGVFDADRVDMGYHYTEGLAQHWLTAEVLPGEDGLLHGSVTPEKMAVFSELQDNVVVVTAIPDPGYKVKQWTGTDDNSTIRTVNTATVIEDTHVTVTFERAARFFYTTEVVDKGDGPHGTLEPQGTWVDEGTTVVLTATPDDGFEVKQWFSTDDNASTSTVNTVLIDANDMVVRVEFTELTRNVLTVPSDYTTIQAAVSAARNGDTVVVDPGVYRAGENNYLILLDKAITITSRFPSDPCSVASTVLDGSANDANRQFPYLGIVVAPGTDNRTVINGLTIRNCGGFVDANPADDGDRGAGHPDGYDGGIGAGSAMLILPNASPLIKNCVFEDNFIVAQDGGSGEDADATNNAGRGGWGGWARGGAIYCASDSSPTFVNCRVLDNYAQGGNGGNGGNGANNAAGDTLPNYGGNYTPSRNVLIDSNSTDVELVEQELWTLWTWDFSVQYKLQLSEDAIIDANLASTGLQQQILLGQPGPYLGDERDYTALGGGVYCGTSSQVTFIHCDIRRNRTYGGISGIGGVPDASPRNIEPLYPTELPSFGGGVYCDTDSLVTFDGCTFNNNVASAVIDGNGVGDGVDVDLDSRPNPYMGYGGGVSTDVNARVIFADCNFVDNQADVGGGIYVKDSLADVVDSNFVRNEALQGGAFAGTGGDIIVMDCNVVANRAVEDIDDPNDDDILPLGAGFYLSSCPAQVTDSNFFSNSTPGSGGAIYIRGNKPLIANCLFRNNGAGHDGGALSINHFAVATIQNATFYRNLADPDILGGDQDMGFGGALFCGSESRTLVTDSIFHQNSAHLGGEFAVMSGNAFNDDCATLTLAHSIISTGPNDVYTECETLFYGDQVLWNVEPQFRSGPLGNHYLASNSPAVDAGSTTSYAAGMTRYTTQTDARKDTPDTGQVDLGYHYRLAEPCRNCDLVKDGRIDFADFAKLALQWGQEGAPGSSWYDGADVTYDSKVDGLDMEWFSLCWLAEDVAPPSSNPSKWSVEPYLDEGRAGMTAEVAEDGWWLDQVEYYFENVSGGGHDSGWQSNPRYVDYVGGASDAYGYRFKVRDPKGNETQWSMIKHASTNANVPPVGPLSLSLLEAGVTYLHLLAQEMFDVDGVQYYIDIDDDSLSDSGWFEFDPSGLVPDPADPNLLIVLDPNDPNMAGPNYRFTQLEPDTAYRFRIKARDKSDDELETLWSDWVSFTTLDATENVPPAPNPLTWDTAVDANGFPGTPTIRLLRVQAGFTIYGVTMTSIVAADVDSPPVEYFFQCTNNGAFSSGWVVDPTYTTPEVGTQGAALNLRFRVKARDQSGNETVWSEELKAGFPESTATGTGTGTGNVNNPAVQQP